MLKEHYEVRMVKSWPDASDRGIHDDTDILLALHARRSASSIDAWTKAFPNKPLVVALTGTDLYRDIHTDADAQRSLQQAARLIVLQDEGLKELPESLRSKTSVVLQSSTHRKTLIKPTRHLRAVMVGHLRDEKWPQTLYEAAQILRPDEGIRIDHIGRAIDPALGEAAERTQAACPHYRWLGHLSHGESRKRIQRAHVLVHTSRMEGGAHVIMEAVQSGTPVLASRVSGNIGMLGADYGGYFPPGDAVALVGLLRQCKEGLSRPGGMLARLGAQCALRAPLFEPAHEQAALLAALTAANQTHP